MLENTNSKSLGRPKKQDSEKVVYQKIPIRYDTYKRLKEITIKEKMTFTNLIEDMIKATYDI